MSETLPIAFAKRMLNYYKKTLKDERNPPNASQNLTLNKKNLGSLRECLLNKPTKHSFGYGINFRKNEKKLYPPVQDGRFLIKPTI